MCCGQIEIPMSKAQRDAGQRAERDARDRLKVLWARVRRGLHQSIGAIEADLEETPVRWEVKSWSQWPQVEDAIDQLQRDGRKYDDPRPQAVLHKRKKKTDWRVTFSLPNFIQFVEEERQEAFEMGRIIQREVDE
jgi:hypothetical protein